MAEGIVMPTMTYKCVRCGEQAGVKGTNGMMVYECRCGANGMVPKRLAETRQKPVQRICTPRGINSPATVQTLAQVIAAQGTELERAFDTQWQRFSRLPPLVKWRFDTGRNFEADRAYIRARVIVECEGIDHRKPERYASDIEKYNRMAEMGIVLFRCTTGSLESNPEGFVCQVADTIRLRLKNTL